MTRRAVVVSALVRISVDTMTGSPLASLSVVALHLQVAVLGCVTAVHEVATGGLPPQVQAEVDVFTVTIAGCAARTAQHAEMTEPRAHTADGAAAVLRAATACAAALCATGHRRGRRWRVPQELVQFLRTPAADAAQGGLQGRTLCFAHSSAARVVDEGAASVPVDDSDEAVPEVAARVRAVMQVRRMLKHAVLAVICRACHWIRLSKIVADADLAAVPDVIIR